MLKFACALSRTKNVINNFANNKKLRYTAFPTGCSLYYDPMYSQLPVTVDIRRGRRLLIVLDHNGQALSYVYFENEKSKRTAVKRFTRDEARRIAGNIVKLPIC